MARDATSQARRPPVWAQWVAGVAGAGVALSFGELVSGITSKVPSLVIGVGEVIVDRTPGSLTRAGIQAAGTNDKPSLIAGIVVLSLVIGAALGRVAVTRPRLAAAGFAVFGLIGGWAAARNPFASGPWSWITALVAAGLGWITLRVLLALAALSPPRTRPRAPNAAADFTGRRAFLTMSGGAAVFALGATSIGRALRNSRSVAAVRNQIALPAAKVAGPAAPATGVLDAAVPGISTFITPNPSFYRIDTALVVPQVDPNHWKLSITGLVDNPYSLTYDEILAMDLVEPTLTLSCVSNEVGDSLVGNAKWLGVPLTTLLDRAHIKSEGKQITGVSADGFTAGFPAELIRDGRTALLVVGMNGQPLPVVHGFPARLLVAGLYGYVSAVKWLKEIRVDDGSPDGYWVPRGWSKLGPIKTQSRIDVPRSSARVTAGHTAIAGIAWAPTKGIAKVEVNVDNGEWQTARLGDATSNETWVQWVLDWDAPKGGHTIKVRATDKTGYTQSPVPVPPAPNGAEGWHTIHVTVS